MTTHVYIHFHPHDEIGRYSDPRQMVWYLSVGGATLYFNNQGDTQRIREALDHLDKTLPPDPFKQAPKEEPKVTLPMLKNPDFKVVEEIPESEKPYHGRTPPPPDMRENKSLAGPAVGADIYPTKHGSPELDVDAEKLEQLGQDPGVTLADLDDEIPF